MEKLLKLLNEYDKITEVNNKWFINDYGCLDREYNWATATSSCRKAISKDYGFIKRLVKNDKINFEKADADISKDIVLGREPDFADFMVYRRFLDEEKVLMLLAISDNPIDFLISVLK